jgi:hypothetical protein
VRKFAKTRERLPRRRSKITKHGKDVAVVTSCPDWLILFEYRSVWVWTVTPVVNVPLLEMDYSGWRVERRDKVCGQSIDDDSAEED